MFLAALITKFSGNEATYYVILVKGWWLVGWLGFNGTFNTE